VLKKISADFGKPYSEVAGVVSFYSFFSTVPRGKYVVRTCLGTACFVKGGAELASRLERRLGVRLDDPAGNGEWALEHVSCLGACGQAPVLVVDPPKDVVTDLGDALPKDVVKLPKKSPVVVIDDPLVI